jgi:hypothetical protein
MTCDALVKFAEAHSGIIEENALLVFTAFLFNSPVPRNWLLLWIRKSFFAIFNAKHPQESADPKQ